MSNRDVNGCGSLRERQSHQDPHDSSSSSSDSENTLNTEDGDWHTIETTTHDSELSSSSEERRCRHHREEGGRSLAELPEKPGCSHYERLCKIVTPCCGEVFPCRHCHNEAKNNVVPNCDIDKLHEVDRFKVEEIICLRCSTKQSVSNRCIGCHVEFAKYFCAICKFWDNQGLQKRLFHCDGCGICRVGGRNNFFHCQTCGSCYPRSLENNHVCIEGAMHQVCPICLEDMFSSTRVVTVLQCGHTIHQECLGLMNRNVAGLSAIRCPLCLHSFDSNNLTWQQFDAAIEETPMPPEHKRDVCIFCNDCQRRTTSPFHFYGCKCGNCGSYNTVEIKE